ncbi:hypothetical protein QOZ80_3AG0226250 [Eleusine coracana subsp. coracana]|nr:hypothetical protein QOZ80_3AG0226250 [Eleusine coracana subsp. coracana]
MSPNGRKHWCKYCGKSFPSGRSLGGHMAMHRSGYKHKKQPSSKPRLPSADDGTCRYGLRARRHSMWLMCDSSDDEYSTLVPKTECQLCFKVFASCEALSMHMRAHARLQQKRVEESREDATMSNGCGVDDFTVSAPVVLTYGVQEVGAARILLMLSGHSDMCSAALEYCNEDYERDSNSDYRGQETEMGLDCSIHDQSGDVEPMKPEECSSDGRMKFSSLSDVLKATAIHKCNVCSKVFTSGSALGGHKRLHRVSVHGKVQASSSSAVAETGQHLIEVHHRSLGLSLPDLGGRYISRIGKSEVNLWWGASNIRSERMLGVV